MKKFIGIGLAVLGLVGVFVLFDRLYDSAGPRPPVVEPMVAVYVFGLANADAILITTPQYTVLIDAGERAHGRYIVERLSDLGLDTVDYFIVTHFDRDHVGGAYFVLAHLHVRHVVVPDYRRVSGHVVRFEAAMAAADLEPYVLTATRYLTLDDALLVLKPSELAFRHFDAEDDDPMENEFSIVVRLLHGANSFLFAADAMAVRLEQLLRNGIGPHCFVKLPHHGRRNPRTDDFLDAVRPRYAVSTCHAGRPLDPRIATRLEDLGASVFLSWHGGVRAVSDGYNLHVVQE